MYSHNNYKGAVRGDANEGTTEYFTLMACKQYGVDRGGTYSAEVAAVARLAKAVGDATLANAYFKGNVTALQAAADAVKLGAWSRWLRDMTEHRMATAGALDFS